MTTDNQTAEQQAAAAEAAKAASSTPSGPTDAEIIAELQAKNLTLAQANRELVLRLAPEDQRSRIEGILADVEAKAQQQNQLSEVETRARDVYAERLELDYKTYGVTKADLLALDKGSPSPETMREYALEKKIDFLEKGTSPNPSTVASDKGGAGVGAGNSSNPQHIEGKGDAVVRNVLRDAFAAKRNGK